MRRTARHTARFVVHRSLTVLAGAAALLLGLIPRSTRDEPRTIVVIRLDLLGDVLHSMQALAGLRSAYPNSRIVMITLPYTAPLARLFDLADEVLELDTNRVRRPDGLFSLQTWRSYCEVYRRMRVLRPDLCLSLSGKTASLVALLIGARRTVGFASEAYPFTLTDAIPGGRFTERRSEVEYVRAVARAAGAMHFPDHVAPRVPPAAQARVLDLLTQHGVRADEPIVVVHGGSINGAAKRWPASQWRSFGAQMADMGLRIVLTGSASDRPIAADIAAGIPGVVSLVGQTSVEELLALLEHAALVASGDSGPLHLGVALQRPVIGIYGPTDPVIHGPFNPVAPTQVFRFDLPCSPCYSMAAVADCPLGDPICMRLVTVDTVVAGARSILSGQASDRRW